MLVTIFSTHWDGKKNKNELNPIFAATIMCCPHIIIRNYKFWISSQVLGAQGIIEFGLVWSFGIAKNGALVSNL